MMTCGVSFLASLANRVSVEHCTQGTPLLLAGHHPQLLVIALSITEKVVVNTGSSFPRPRIHFSSTLGQFYIGNEGFIDQYGIFGSDVTNPAQVSSPLYTPGQYDTLSFVANGSSLSLTLDGTLIETATRTSIRPLNVEIVPGDGFSQDTMSITAIGLTAVPEPASFSVIATSVALLLVRRRKATN
jgi:hypothetical protein